MPASYLRSVALPLAGAGPMLNPSRRWPVRGGEARPSAPAEPAPPSNPRAASAAPEQRETSAPSRMIDASVTLPADPPASREERSFVAPSPRQDLAALPREDSLALPHEMPVARSRNVGTRDDPAPQPVQQMRAAQPGTVPSDALPVQRSVERRADNLEHMAENLVAMQPGVARPASRRTSPPRAFALPVALAHEKATPAAEAIAPLAAARGSGEAAIVPRRIASRPPRAAAQEPGVPLPPVRPAPRSDREAAAIKIGTIEVRVKPPPAPPQPPARAKAAPARSGALSRGLSSPFGLRQG